MHSIQELAHAGLREILSNASMPKAWWLNPAWHLQHQLTALSTMCSNGGNALGLSVWRRAEETMWTAEHTDTCQAFRKRAAPAP